MNIFLWGTYRGDLLKIDTIIRTAVLALALINQCLTASGRSIIPIEEESLSNIISLGFTIGAALTAWWKNNSFTKCAIEADEYLQKLKNERK